MKVLFVCHRFPFPPKRGGKIRPFNIIRHLALSHEVTVCSLSRSAEETREATGIEDYCKNFHLFEVNERVQWARMVLRLPSSTPSSMGYFYSSKMERKIRELLAAEKFDIVFVHCSSVAQYVRGATDTLKVLDFGDMDSQKWLDYRQFKPWPLSLGYWLEGKKMERAEKSLAADFDLCTATTRAEWQHLDSLQAAKRTDWFPNGVDSNLFCPSTDPYESNRICFVGRMDYFPNQQAMFEFCSTVWPRLLKRHPEMLLDIVGADPTKKVKELGELPGVTVTGSVPDVRPYVRKSLLMVAPLRIARGTQNKILESMALGVPVVTTSLAAGGVDALSGEHLKTADSADELIDAISFLYKNPQERKRLSLAGRKRVLVNHSWANSMTRLDAIIQSKLLPAGNAAEEPESDI